jgi:ribosome recycling factor
MDYKDLIKAKKRDFDAAFEWTRSEISSIRTGRANSALVEDIQVDYMGSKLKIKELATITTPEPRTITIQPWDKQAIILIEKAIRDNSHGLSPSADSNSVRVSIPSLTEERRKELTRELHKKIEEGRIKIRRIREDILRRVQNDESSRDDDLRKSKDELQKQIDEFNKKFDELIKKKEAELMN